MGANDYLLRHAEACKTVTAGYIERSTRFNIKDVHFDAVQSALHTFRIAITHQLSVDVEVHDDHGRRDPGPNDFGTADWAWYQQEVAAQGRAELARRETLDELVELVRSRCYAAIGTSTRLRTHPRQLFHTYTCAGCDGRGQNTCDGCSGKGTVPCNWCHGSGRCSCSQCNGSGHRLETRHVTDYNGYTRSETRHVNCSACSGGRVNCSSCWGSGRQHCGTCGGSGKLTCTGCSGHGCLTRVSTTHIHTTPRFTARYAEGAPAYVAETVKRVGFGALERHGDIALPAVDLYRDDAVAQFVYECTMPFCELTVDMAGGTSAWVLFGSQPEILDAGGALETLLRGDFDALAITGRSGARWLPWFHRTAANAVAPFMASELHQLIVEESTVGKGTAAIVERANRSVSQGYVDQALAHLHHIVRAAAHWSRIKWFVALNLLALPAALGAFRYLHGDVPVTASVAAARYDIGLPGHAGFSWEFALLATPFALVGGGLARWASLRWLKRAGGARSVAWAKARNLPLGALTVLLVTASAGALAGKVFDRWPLWVDGQGRAYGVLPFYSPPQVVAALPEPPAEPRLPKRKKAVEWQPAPEPVQESVQEPAPSPEEEAAAPVEDQAAVRMPASLDEGPAETGATDTGANAVGGEVAVSPAGAP